MPRLVLDLVDRRPFGRMPMWVAECVRDALPDDWQVVVVETPSDGTGDGGTGASPEALAAVAEAEVYFGLGVPREVPLAGAGLRWVHTATAGVAGSLSPELRTRDVVLTNSAGVHAAPIAETVVGMMFHFARGLDFAVRGQAAGRWRKEPFDAVDAPIGEVAGSTVGIIGFGGIGRAVAARALPLGARVLGLKRRRTGRAGHPPPNGAELTYGSQGLDRLLATSDYVVLAAPETEETSGLIDAEALARMKDSAVLINVARGGLVDEDALIATLRAGRLRGAALDVFRTEPLPEDHPFWSLPNVLITPHISAYTSRFWEREVSLLEENLERYLAGRELVNVVDKAAGY